KRCLVNQREVGDQTHSFAAALRSALREDPDVILVGELRDLETTSLAMTAAETGHLVLATMHTASAPKTVDRIIDIYPTGQSAQSPPVFRVDGVSYPGRVLLQADEIATMASSLMSMAQREAFRANLEMNLTFSLGDGQRFRANLFWQQGVQDMVVRSVRTQVR